MQSISYITDDNNAGENLHTSEKMMVMKVCNQEIKNITIANYDQILEVEMIPEWQEKKKSS